MKMRSPRIITIITAILAAASIPAVFAQRQPSANEIYIDKDCRRNQQLQFDKFTVFNQNEFTAHKTVLLRFSDSTCIHNVFGLKKFAKRKFSIKTAWINNPKRLSGSYTPIHIVNLRYQIMFFYWLC